MANHNRPMIDGDAPPVHLLEKFIDNQSKELSIRSQEIELQAQENKQTAEISHRALEFQAQDRRETRQFMLSQRKQTLILSGTLVVVFLAVVAFAMYSGNSSVAIEMLKAVGYIATGLLGGYGYAKSRPKDSGDGGAQPPSQDY